MLIYDFKFNDLTKLSYHAMNKYKNPKSKQLGFYVINFDDLRYSHRCNALHPQHLESILDAYEAASCLMLNLNRSWIQKQGDFFVESPILLLSAVIWYLKLYQNGKYCTLPHVIELINQPYKELLTLLSNHLELRNYLSAFQDALQGGAQDQLQGQLASLKIPLSRLVSKNMYWVLSGNDFTLDLNNPRHPKVVCIGNNPQRQQIYGAAIGLYISRVMKLVNKKKQHDLALIIDELPTVFVHGLDHFIATARSNRIATCLILQDFSQLVRDYGERQSRVVFNTIGNIISGQVLGETAKLLSERFGRILQTRQGYSSNTQDISNSISTQLDALIPSAKISQLSQGFFVGCLTQTVGVSLDQPVFHAKLHADASMDSQVEQITLPFTNSGKLLSTALPLEYYVEKNFRDIKIQIHDLVQRELMSHK